MTIVDELPDLHTHQCYHCLSPTGVYLKTLGDNHFAIRWFTASGPIQRCGHGTLAAAAFLEQQYPYSSYRFSSDIETLNVVVEGNNYCLELPLEPLSSAKNTLAFHYYRCAQTTKDDGYIIVELKDEAAITQFVLTDAIKNTIHKRALIISARSSSPEYDIIFRYFAPYYGEDEDSATGSAAAILWPFWHQTINKALIQCYQSSNTGGYMQIKEHNDKVIVMGRAAR